MSQALLVWPRLPRLLAAGLGPSSIQSHTNQHHSLRIFLSKCNRIHPQLIPTFYLMSSFSHPYFCVPAFAVFKKELSHYNYNKASEAKPGINYFIPGVLKVLSMWHQKFQMEFLHCLRICDVQSMSVCKTFICLSTFMCHPWLVENFMERGDCFMIRFAIALHYNGKLYLYHWTSFLSPLQPNEY